MQQPKLTSLFKRIAADEVITQRQGIADTFQREHPPAAAAAAISKPGPGRPCKKRELALEQADERPANKPRTCHYTNWFSSPYITDIMQALRKHDYSTKRALAALKRGAPDDRYAHLSDSTMRGWFDKEDRRKLLPHFQQQFSDRTAAARSSGRPSLMSAAVEDAAKNTLLKLRDCGMPVNSYVIRWTLQSIFRTHDPSLLDSLALSQQWISSWVRAKLQWRWRARTTAAGKLPHDWEEQGVLMAKRIAAKMQMHKVRHTQLQLALYCCAAAHSRASFCSCLQVHPSLIVNMDQTGQNLVPAAAWTYEIAGAAAVGVVGAEDKRQITACIASSLSGELLPLQLVFQGKTRRCLPTVTASSIAARVHITNSQNHWSTQETMRDWITEVLLPYAERCITTHELPSDAKIILVLDVWAVHKSEEFRRFLRTHHPRIHLVFVPANCTSKLQVADVALQRPFKSSVKRSFDAWASEQLHEQISSGVVVGLREKFRMGVIKPLLLQWCIDSWQQLKDRKQIILGGWSRCCTQLYDVHSPEKRIAAVTEVALHELDDAFVPEEEEDVEESDTEDVELELEPEHESSDSERDELDLTRPVTEGARRSTRQRTQTPAAAGSYMLDSQALAMTEDSD